MRIIADNTVPYLKGVLEPVADVSYLDSKAFTPMNIREADALIVRSIDKCTRELLEGSRVRLITTATIGYDHIDTHYCEEAGITWKNAPGCNAASVGQYVLSSLVAVALRKGERLAGKTIGIVGVGHVGSIVARHCETMGMRVLRNDPPRAEQEGEAGFVSLETIAREADIITLHVPLTKEGRFATRHLADQASSTRFVANAPNSMTGSEGAGGTTSLSFSIRISKKCSIFSRHIRVPFAFPSAEKPAIWGVAMVASDSNSRSISGSFSQQSMISSLTLPVRLARNRACVSCTAPRQLLINQGFRSNRSKKA